VTVRATVAPSPPDVLSRQLAGAVLARAASTVVGPAGTFRATQYDALEPEQPTDQVGAQIALEFTPELPVDGRVGLIQVIDHGAQGWVDAPKEMAGKPRDAAVKFTSRVVGQSPVFGALRDPTQPNPGRPLTLADTTQPSHVIDLWETAAHQGAVSKEAAEAHESTYTSRRGEIKLPLKGRVQTGGRSGSVVTPAALMDRPGFAADQPHAKQLVTWSAEAAAVVLDGPLEGAYLGSVRWGWRSEPQEGGLPTVRLVPDSIELVSGFVPSKEFLQAGLRWNKTLTLADDLGTHSIVPVPVPTAYGFERWDLNAEPAARLVSVKNWLVKNWGEAMGNRGLRILAWRLVPALRAKGEDAVSDDLLRQFGIQARLESLRSMEDFDLAMLT
jgi:hypothetical protein